MKIRANHYASIIGLFLISMLLSGCTYTVSKTSTNDEVKLIDGMIDKWHLAAAEADFETYFDLMDAEGYFIGTDASEKWNIAEFKAFCEPIFERESAWTFTKREREIFMSDSRKMAWFDEQLDTWMGICMSSGVVVKTEIGWKIKHYQLAIAVPNDIVDDFIQLVKNYEEKPETNDK